MTSVGLHMSGGSAESADRMAGNNPPYKASRIALWFLQFQEKLMAASMRLRVPTSVLKPRWF